MQDKRKQKTRRKNRTTHAVRVRASAIALLLIFCLVGCTVGPDFHKPEAPGLHAYTRSPLPEKTSAASGAGGESQRFVFGEDIPDQWWTLFHSEALDKLVRRAIENSPTLASARAALRQAQENLASQTGVVRYPSVDAAALIDREKFSGAVSGQPGQGTLLTLYNASVNVGYTIDVFGGGRRELEALRALVDYQNFQLEAAHLTLTSNIVTAAVRGASFRAQILATRNIISLLEKQLGVVEQQFRLGGASLSDVLAQRTQLAQTRVTLPVFEKGLAETEHLLATLTGSLPAEGDIPEFSLDDLQLPQDLPVSLPSLLVRQRPDIRAAEALLHQASAQVGVATANLYPQISLTGRYGSETTELGNLFGGGTSVWNLSAGVLQPIFHGGELTAKRNAAEAAYDQAAAQYRETVLLAFQNVADVLRALDSDAAALTAQTEAETAAREALALTESQFKLGAVNYLSLLTAQRQYRLAQTLRIQAQTLRFADTAALFQALGGGWWNRKE